MTQASDSSISPSLMEEAQRILESITIPSPPRVLIGIQQELSRSEPSFTTILALISEDVAMTAKMIKVANSPFFATRNPVKSLEMALPVLGLENFRNIILTSALRHAFDAFEQSGLPPEEMERFHEHALIVGRSCQLVGTHVDEKRGPRLDVGEAYMAGLFHDCGMPMLAQRFPGYFAWLRDAFHGHIDALEYEEEMARTNHCIIGGFVAKVWQLPDAVRGAITFHQGPVPGDIDPAARILAAVVRVAETLLLQVADFDASEALYYPSTEDARGFQQALAMLGLDHADLETLMQRLGAFFSEEE